MISTKTLVLLVCSVVLALTPVEAQDQSGPVKLVSALRRKPNMTRKEFLDYHFQEHGKISDYGTLDEKPLKYRQYHIFDSAFGERAAVNKNQAWFWRDDVTELYFNNVTHLLDVFNSDHVTTVVEPDGNNFNDFETNIPWFGYESVVPINTTAAAVYPVGDDLEENGRHVALYFVSSSSNSTNLTTAFREEIEAHAQSDARALVVGTSSVSSEFNLTAYFGGADMPKYSTIFTIALESAASTAAIRKAQTAFVARSPEVNTSESFIVFAKMGLVLDYDGVEIPFDGERQPHMNDLSAW